MEPRRHELYARLAPLLTAGRDGLGDVRWFDAHTHIGQNDPDGYKAVPRDILDGLDAAGHERALLFAMHEPDGYTAANDAVLEACAAAEGRLEALCRVDPDRPGAVEEVRRCLAAGARGVKLHPRSDDFALPHDVVADIVALAAERRAPVLFHAGRGIPNLGEAAAALARENPGARIILAHCGISDLGLLGPVAQDLPNLMFDTAWWQVSDVLALFASVPPGQILYASDMPYGAGLFAAFMVDRCARAVGLGPQAIRGIAGAQLERVVAGEDLLDLGPAPGHASLGPRIIGLERVIAYASAAVQTSFRGGDPAEALSLARLACQTPDPDAEHHALLTVVDDLLALAQRTLEETPELRMRMVPAVLVAQAIAGTPEAGVPPVGV